MDFSLKTIMPMSQNLCSQIGMFSRKLFQAVLQKFSRLQLLPETG
jgi:hypothetical protein